MTVTYADLERARVKFATNDVSLEAFAAAALCGRELAAEPYARLARDAFGRDPENALAAARELARAVERWGSFILLQGLAGTAFARLGMYEEALAMYAAALPTTPRWHATSAYRALESIADALDHLGRHDEAARFAEEALRWDPTNPYALSVLARASAKSGKSERAGAIRRYLAACNYPESFLADLATIPDAEASYAPDLGLLAGLSEDEWYRFRAVNSLNPFADGEEKRRAHAIACFQRGRYDYAIFASRQASRWQAEESPFEPAVTRAWNAARIAAIEASPVARERLAAAGKDATDRFAEESHYRFELVDGRTAAGDEATLLAMLDDPNREMVIYVSKALIKLGQREQLSDVGHREHLSLLEALAAGERAMKLEVPSVAKLLASAKKKGGARKPVGKRKATTSARLALVEKVIARVRAHVAAPRPVPAEVLARLTFPGDRPLSPALRAFLAFDASFLEIFDDPASPCFSPKKLSAVAAQGFDRRTAGMYEGIDRDLPGDAYLLGPRGSNCLDVLYVGEPDLDGEYPVLTLDCDQGPDVYVSYPGIDVYLADIFEVAAFNADERKADDRALEEHRKLNLGGQRSYLNVDDDDDL